jgi:uncharacterized protein YlxW (UPF0749 family)
MIITRVNSARREASSFQAVFANRTPKLRRNAICFLNNADFWMKQISFITILAAVVLLLTPAVAQTPTQKDADDLNALLKDVQAQQAEIAENQAKIEEKLAALSETIRQARIFSSRGGR